MKRNMALKMLKKSWYIVAICLAAIIGLFVLASISRRTMMQAGIWSEGIDKIFGGMWTISLAIFVVVITIGLITHFRRNIALEERVAMATDELRISLDVERQRLKIIGALAETYVCVYHVDLSDFGYKEIVSKDYVREIIKPHGDMREALTRYVYKAVGTDEQTRMLKFCDMTTLAARLNGQSQIFENFKGLLANGLCKASFTVVDTDEEGKPLQVIFACQYIEQEGVLSDRHILITELDKLRVEDKKKKDLLLNIGEDIKTPISGIKSLVGIANGNIDNPSRVKDCLDKIENLSEVLLNYTSDIVDLTKVETGRMELKNQQFNLNSFVLMLEAKATPRAALKEQVCQIEVENLNNAEVIGDEGALYNVVMSLLNNSMKYTPKMEKIDCTLSEKPSRHRGYGCYEVEIKDKGIGMTDAYLKMTMDLSPREEDRTVSGTGLNLPSIRNILRMMDGDIRVISNQKTGTTFVATFFLKIVNN